MYPKQHALVSGAAVLAYSLFLNLPPTEIAVWVGIGMFTGVLIDVDHVLLSMVVAGRYEQGLSWFQRPMRAVLDPEALLEDMEYDRLLYHRLLSHLFVFVILVSLISVHRLFISAAAGLAVHIASDILWDMKQGSYGF